MEAFGIPAGEDEGGSLLARSPGRFEPDAGATADHDDGSPGKLRFALSAHDSSDGLCKPAFCLKADAISANPFLGGGSERLGVHTRVSARD
jgi:hypothetical protein